MIIEASSLEDIAFPLSSFVLFDLDNTLIWSKSYFGSEEWERDMIAEFQKKGHPENEAFHKANLFWKKAQTDVQMELVEEGTHSFFHNTIHKIGLTARTFDLSDVTVQQLSNLGIYFDSYSFSHPFFYEGVLFCGDEPKGEMAFEFFQHHNYFPKQLIAIDDRRIHLETIMEKAQIHSLELLAFHYQRSLHRFR